MATQTALVSIMCEDRAGLIADVTGRLYELGINLGDTTFAVLGSGAKFTLVAKLPPDVTIPDVEEDLRSMPVLRGAELSVAPFVYRETHDPSAYITHRIEITGDDSPGLIARLSEALRQIGANIVELNSESVPGASGARFLLRMSISVPKGKEAVCMATVANTAGQMNLSCRWEQV
ncbi:glycine cleavage system protein R [Dongia deserti]|uniref:glycine cleavage system protein R n=1 Tax=Dongia deserti TaxID=2268030 RepID=UPI000E646F49|nr:ACT domain-containing protein [Dongia deserti]